MKSSFLITLSVLLVTAILAPSIITLTGSNPDATAIIDFSEEEKKEEKKESAEKDLLYALDFQVSSLKDAEESSTILFSPEGNYSSPMDVFLPPPETL